MKKLEVVLKFIKHIVWGLILQGILFILIGILIFMYPDLLGMLVGIGLVVSGLLAFVLAIKVNKYSSFKFNV
ncbi:MAG: hypothetical protein CO137_02600 [Candidatus Magasanikbacteria bacterium CG_4_9_14_3_um_filter_32_9]|uniref:Uncharacterized protein n=1 Tax=Candidatus Magasanikbacteria bacterium CG_4_9_14_3_um_filter_32_9 TaxID=1974644 RepID=A0A2M7Z6J0_9BACT|nr:MAG: hypothetical protein CO137_02600 [Candidatus Magasanikbacteria bacterium CG_4_9_14_3_um_filter_32_9]